ncbi:MAG: FtsH protease activity modulator HflK [Hyphomicrobiaceae bacterium]
MPWSNQGGSGGGGGGGPWGKGGGGGGPWGQGPSGGGGQPPNDFEDILKRSQDRFRQAIPGGGMSRGLTSLLVLLGLAAAVFYLCTVRVNPEEQGIVTRFGKVDRTLLPGLNLRLPYPIEEVYLPKVTEINSIQAGKIGATGASDSGLMLTGDGTTIVDVGYFVRWRISDAEKFLFSVRDGEQFLSGGVAPTVQEVAESAVREVIGRSTLQSSAAENANLAQRAVAEKDIHDLMQSVLDSYNSGVEITLVGLQAVDPPAPVIDAYRAVQAAQADYETIIKQAEKYASEQLPIAGGEAKKIVQEAEAYKERVLAEARGQAKRFSSIYAEYQKAPDVTRQRMYLETMERVLGAMDKIIVDQKQGGVVPYLPLNEVAKQKSPSATGGQ